MTRDRAVPLLALFLLVTGIATWMGSINGGAAFALGIGFRHFVAVPLLRWVEGL